MAPALAQATAGVAPEAASAAAPLLEQRPTTVCKLIVQAGKKGTTSTASLACTGPAITVAAHKSLKPTLTKTASGVAWDAKSCEHLGCLLTICGRSSATFRDASVMGLQDGELSAGICVSGDSNIIFEGGTFSHISTNQGALLVLGSSRVLFHGTKVTNNTAYTPHGLMTMGGGVLVQERARVRIEGSLFAGNHGNGSLAAALGAALAAQDTAHVSISNSSFLTNTVTAPGVFGAAIGGAIHAEGSASVEADYVLFHGNAANGSLVSVGGAVSLLHNATLKLLHCTFTNNTARSAASGLGGAVAAANSTLVTATNSTFAYNGVVGSAGAGAGGALLAGNDARTVITDGRFVGNWARGSVAGGGGAVMAADQAELVLSGTQIVDNWVEGSLASSGGGIAAFGNATVRLSTVGVVGNGARSGIIDLLVPVMGGGVSCFNSSRVLLSDSTITRNYANSSKGAAVAGGLGVIDQAQMHVVRCNVTRNWAKGAGSSGGGGIWAMQVNGTKPGVATRLVVESSRFESNTVTAFENNAGYAGAGAVGALGDVDVVLRRTLFINNHVAGVSATTAGAVLGASSARVVIESCQFTGNTVAGIRGFTIPSLLSGGGAVGVQMVADVLIQGSSFSFNSVEGTQSCGGGVSVMQGGVVHLSATTFLGNHASGHTVGGGAMCATDNGTLHVDHVQFTANFAKGGSQGGAAWLNGNSSAVLSHSNFSSNTAGWAGGAIVVRDGCKAVVNGCSFENNTASNTALGCGGAIAVGFEGMDVASCTITGSSFVNNRALGNKGSGGAVHSANAAINISHSSFLHNLAQQGGGLGGYGEWWNVTNSSFVDHSVAGPGGAIFVSGSLKARIIDSTILHNRYGDTFPHDTMICRAPLLLTVHGVCLQLEHSIQCGLPKPALPCVVL